MKPKIPNAKTRVLFRKLHALAERGVDGERIVAQNKLARLQARYDFSLPARDDAPDLFSGKFARSSAARRIYLFNSGELDIANSVKWAVESATRIPCAHRGAELVAEATAATARRLAAICDHIAQSFRVLLRQFCGLDGVTAADRSAFLMGLYDGMMGDVRDAGQRLPARYSGKKRGRKKLPKGGGAGMHVHPYSIAVGLGKQIRFSAPVEQITAELETAASNFLAH